MHAETEYKWTIVVLDLFFDGGLEERFAIQSME